MENYLTSMWWIKTFHDYNHTDSRNNQSWEDQKHPSVTRHWRTKSALTVRIKGLLLRWCIIYLVLKQTKQETKRYLSTFVHLNTSENYKFWRICRCRVLTVKRRDLNLWRHLLFCCKREFVVVLLVTTHDLIKPCVLFATPNFKVMVSAYLFLSHSELWPPWDAFRLCSSFKHIKVICTKITNACVASNPVHSLKQHSIMSDCSYLYDAARYMCAGSNLCNIKHKYNKYNKTKRKTITFCELLQFLWKHCGAS